jgi:hypothetical protein
MSTNLPATNATNLAATGVPGATLSGLDLYNLLPAVYKLRDAQAAAAQPLLTPVEAAQLAELQALTPPLSSDRQAQLAQLLARSTRGPLQSLLMLVQEQLAALAYDLDQLYDDQFIETCAPWVIPYIGDLIGYQSIQGIAPSVDNPRSEVANTISFRRRKGTVLVMEQLARDATGWGAHAVEFFRVLADTQYMNHIRLHNDDSPDERRWKPGLYIDSGFDRTAHTVDVRRIASRRGRYNIQNIGIFLWSLSACSVTDTPATPVAGNPQCYRFSSLGRDIPLFHQAVSQGATVEAPATPINVPDRLRRRVLCRDLQGGVGASYYGPGNSLSISIGGQLLNPYQIQVCNLSGADGSWANLPASNTPYLAVVDPELGRLAIPAPAAGDTPAVEVSCYYGFNASMGGGEYPRENTFLVDDLAWVYPFPDTVDPPRYATLQDAIDYAISGLAFNGQAAVEIIGSGIYSVPALTVTLPAGATLELRASEASRPTLILDGEIAATGAASSSFVINGLLISSIAAAASPSPVALVHIPALEAAGSPNLLTNLSLTHCTLVPGWSLASDGTPVQPVQPTLVAEPAGLTVAISDSIVGGIRAGSLVTAALADSILDSTDRANVAYAALDSASGGGALTLTGCTVVGKVHAVLLTLVSDSILWAQLADSDAGSAIWTAPLIADRKQAGCVRFSYLPTGAVIPRHFQCVTEGPASPQPLFFSLRYGDPAYAKLLTSTSDAIRRAADDGGEMGAFHFVLAPLRETDLRIRMQEYIPAGLEFGIIYQN